MGRSPLSVTKGLKDAVEIRGGVSQLDLNDRFLLDSTLPSNMADGSLTNIGHTKIELLGQLFKRAFEVVTEDTSVMIIVDDRPTLADTTPKSTPSPAQTLLMKSLSLCQIQKETCWS